MSTDPKLSHSHDHHISAEWEEACIKSRRYLWLRRRRLRMFDLKKTDRVLDLGCGDGLNIVLLKQMGIKDIVGLDMSKNLIREAKKNNPDVKFYVGFAEDLPFQNNQFDIVLVDSVFHHLMRYTKTIQEIKRVLTRNGLLCFSEPHQMFLRRVLDFISTLPVAQWIPVLRERSIGYLDERDLMTHWLATENQFLKLLRKYGFKKVFQRHDLLSVVAEHKNI